MDFLWRFLGIMKKQGHETRNIYTSTEISIDMIRECARSLAQLLLLSYLSNSFLINSIGAPAIIYTLSSFTSFGSTIIMSVPSPGMLRCEKNMT